VSTLLFFVLHMDMAETIDRDRNTVDSTFSGRRVTNNPVDFDLADGCGQVKIYTSIRRARQPQGQVNTVLIRVPIIYFDALRDMQVTSHIQRLRSLVPAQGEQHAAVRRNRKEHATRPRW